MKLCADNSIRYTPEEGIRILTTESLLGGNSFATLTQTFPSLIGKMNEVAESVRLYVSSSSEQSAQARKALDKVKKLDYVEIGDKLIDVPEGFRGDLPSYINDLATIMPEIIKETSRLLGDYNIVLANFITNKEARSSFKDSSKAFEKSKERRNQVRETLFQYFTDKNKFPRIPLKNALARLGDLESIVKSENMLSKMKLEKSLEEISRETKLLSETMAVLYDSLESESFISPQAAKNISEGAYELALQVEFVGTVKFMTDSAMLSVERLYETINKF